MASHLLTSLFCCSPLATPATILSTLGRGHLESLACCPVSTCCGCTPCNRTCNRTSVALVTGANRGVGYHTAKILLNQGLTVYLLCRDLESGQRAAKKTSGSNGKSIRRSVSCRSQRPYHCHKVSSRNPSTPNKSRLPRQQRGNDWFGGHEHQPSRPFRADSRSNTCAQAWCDHRQTCVFSSARHFQHRQRRFGRSLARGNDDSERGCVAARHVEV